MKRGLSVVLISLLLMLSVGTVLADTTFYEDSPDYADYNTANSYAGIEGMESNAFAVSWNVTGFTTNQTTGQSERNMRAWVNSTTYCEVKVILYQAVWTLAITVVEAGQNLNVTQITLAGDEVADTQTEFSFVYDRFEVHHGVNSEYGTTWHYDLNMSATTTTWNFTSVSVGGSAFSWTAGESYILAYSDTSLTTRATMREFIPVMLVIALVATVLGVFSAKKRS